MAKMTHCEFCGKELKKGLFTGQDYPLDLGLDFITCCKECYDRYEKAAARNRERFSVKMRNYRAATKKKVEPEMVKQMFLDYLAQERALMHRQKHAERVINFGFFAADDEGLFAVREADLDADFNAKQMTKTLKNANKVGETQFNKDDITRIEYRTTMFGESTGLFSTAYPFVIRFNDEKEFTYKPCVTKMVFVGKGLWPHTQKKKAKEACESALQLFKEVIGSDLPIREVKSFH